MNRRWLLVLSACVGLVDCGSTSLVLETDVSDSGADVEDGVSDGGLDAETGVSEGDGRSEGVVCAQRDPPGCVALCDTKKFCYTGVTCGPGGPCSMVESYPGDDRCHRGCEDTADCEEGETCQSKQFFACQGYNGARRICLRD